MIGAIAGDIIGSIHEGEGTKTKDFPLFVEYCRFTDDTVLTVAVASQLLHGGMPIMFAHRMCTACCSGLSMFLFNLGHPPETHNTCDASQAKCAMFRSPRTSKHRVGDTVL